VSTSPESESSEEGEPLLGTRRQARELALSLLYEADTKTAKPAEVLAEFPIDPDPFAADLVAGVGDHQTEIDDVIRRFAKDWSLERMPVVDRNLLRIGIYELLHRPDVPTAAVISEAVELARRYSTEESGRFVNGMLGRIAEDVRPER
jgi:transcription antitermination protein NusB